MIDGTEVVTLRNGDTLPVAVLRLAWSLEDRGIVMREDGDKLKLSRKDGQGTPLLSSEERAAVTRWKTHLLAIVSYKPPS
jgi:hypothetical protein